MTMAYEITNGFTRIYECIRIFWQIRNFVDHFVDL